MHAYILKMWPKGANVISRTMIKYIRVVAYTLCNVCICISFTMFIYFILIQENEVQVVHTQFVYGCSDLAKIFGIAYRKYPFTRTYLFSNACNSYENRITRSYYFIHICLKATILLRIRFLICTNSFWFFFTFILFYFSFFFVLLTVLLMVHAFGSLPLWQHC